MMLIYKVTFSQLYLEFMYVVIRDMSKFDIETKYWRWLRLAWL